MQYYVIQIEHYNDGTKNSYGIYTFDELDAALASLYQRMASGIKNEKVSLELCQILTSGGSVQRIERWVEPAPEPEPVDEEQGV